VIAICNETATVRHGKEETRMLLSELLEEDYKSQDRYMASLWEALNSGDGEYRP
jgi:hypothetical protein